MEPTRLLDSNVILGTDQVGVRPIHAKRWTDANRRPNVSVAFQPDAEELERLNQGLPVVVTVWGTTIQPTIVGVGAHPSEEGETQHEV